MRKFCSRALHLRRENDILISFGGDTVSESRIDRINELAHKKKTVGLTPEEQEEQDRLRKEYIAAFRQNVIAQLDNTYIKRPDGSVTKLQQKRK